MALILVHCYQRSCWMAACLGTTLFNKYFLQGRSLLGICRINQELSLLKTLSAASLMRNVESADDSVILEQTGCGVCAMWGINRQCQFLAHAILVFVQQGQLLVHFSKLKRAGQSLQDKSFCCAQASSSVKSACAKAHLQLVSLCCPTTLLESEVIVAILGYYVGIGLSDIAESWNSHWVRRNENTGLWSSLCSSNLMCGLIPGYMPSSCFHAEERTYRMLMEGIPSSSHKTSADHVTDCLQESSTPSLYTLCFFVGAMFFHWLHVPLAVE